MNVGFKKGLYILGISVLVGLMASCLGGNENKYDDFSFTDAELLQFSLFHTDSLPELEYVVFSIDHRGENGVGLIYNKDSMAYMTELPEIVFVEYTSGAGTNNVLNVTDGDSIWLKPGDSIDISKPQTLKVYALDGKTTKLYTAQLNIHQVNPDSVQYRQIASDLSFLQTENTKTVVFNGRFLSYSEINSEIQLHSSQDAVDWTREISGLPENTVIRGIQSNGSQLFAYTDDGELFTRYDPADDQWILVNKPSSLKIRSILGYLKADPKHTEGLSLIVEIEGKYVFAFTQDFIHWDYNDDPVPDDFPVYDFSNHSYQLMLTERISIFGGVSLDGTIQNAVWSTETGRYWAKLTGSTNVFPLLKGTNVFFYDQEFWLINGIFEDGYYNFEVYFSIDGGVTWATKPIKYQPQEDDVLRYGASLVVDESGKYFYIIGGKKDNVRTDVWKVFLNKKEFKQ